jgi:hypothetical protein
MEQNAEVAKDAREHGWKLGQWDGFDTPVFDKMQTKWYLLLPNGTKAETHPPMFLI